MGGTLLSLEWKHPSSEWIALVVPSHVGNTRFDGGSFLMAPFANRIADGQFSFNEEIIQFPVNEQINHNALHGLSRNVRGEVVAQSDVSLTCLHPVRDAETGYHYDLTQTITLTDSGVDFTLEVTHRGDKPRPYGFGFHPWFPRKPQTQLSFVAETFFHRNDRGLVTEPSAIQGHWDFTTPVLLSELPWFDAHYSGWTDCKAELVQPEDELQMVLTASGALTNLHVYVPDTRDIVCIEPVSHVPDVHNKRHLASYGDLTVLQRDQSLTGHMHIRAEAL